MAHKGHRAVEIALDLSLLSKIPGNKRSLIATWHPVKKTKNDPTIKRRPQHPFEGSIELLGVVLTPGLFFAKSNNMTNALFDLSVAQLQRAVELRQRIEILDFHRQLRKGIARKPAGSQIEARGGSLLGPLHVC